MRKYSAGIVCCFILAISLCFSALAAISPQKMQDTAVERLMQTGQYKATARFIAGKLAGKSPGMSSDTRLYYFTQLSMAQLRCGNFDSAKQCALRSISLSSSSGDSAPISNSWKVMAYAYNRSGQLDSALFFTGKLLNYAKRVGDDRQCRNALTSMGTILMQNKRPAEALTVYREAIQAGYRMKDSLYFATGLYNIGLAQLALKQYDSSLATLKNVVFLARQHTQQDVLLMAYGTLSDCYLEMGNKEERKKNLLLANSVAAGIGNYQFMAMGFSSLSREALMEKNYREALKFGLQADSLLKKQPYPVFQMRVDSLLYAAFKNLGKKSESFTRLEEFVKLKEKVTGESQDAMLNKLVVEYSVREKNLTIENQILEISSNKKQLQLLLLLLFLTCLLIAGLLNYIVKKRRFRETLYRKEKYLDRQIAEMMHYKQQYIHEKPSPDEALSARVDRQGTDEEKEKDQGLQNELYLRFLDILETQKLYLDPGLNLKTLTNLLGTNRQYLYQAISTNTEDNFKSLINRCRVNEAKRLIEEGVAGTQSFDTTAIYSAAGFNSAGSFFRAFKLYTALTPKEYANETRKEFRKQGTSPPKPDEMGDDDM